MSQNASQLGDPNASVNIPNVGAQIQTRLGIRPQAVNHSEIVFLLFVVDDSRSIHDRHNEQLVRDGYNKVINRVKQKRTKNNILVCCTLLNRGVLYDYSFIDDVPLLDESNYRGRGGTPLYDRTGEALRNLKAKFDEFENTGIDVRTVTVIITDGVDYGSHMETPATVNRRIRLMIADEKHTILGIGIDDGRTDFRQVFVNMGLDPNCVKVPSDNEEEFMQIMEMVSQISVAATQGVNLGGFATP